MTAGELSQIITAVGVLLTAMSSFGAFAISWRNGRKLEIANAKLEIASAKIEQVHVATNSLQDKLVAATASASKAEGIEIGRAETKT